MIDISTGLAIGWTIGTGILWAGISYGVVRMTQKSFRMDLDKLFKKMDASELRQSRIEREYRKIADCIQEQEKCEKHRDYHESTILSKLDDLKFYLVSVDEKQTRIRDDLNVKLDNIKDKISAIEKSIPGE